MRRRRESALDEVRARRRPPGSTQSSLAPAGSPAPSEWMTNSVQAPPPLLERVVDWHRCKARQERQRVEDVGLTGAVGPDEDRQRLQVDRELAERLEPIDLDARDHGRDLPRAPVGAAPRSHGGDPGSRACFGRSRGFDRGSRGSIVAHEELLRERTRTPCSPQRTRLSPRRPPGSQRSIRRESSRSRGPCSPPNPTLEIDLKIL